MMNNPLRYMNKTKLKRVILLILMDIALIGLAQFLALFLRFEMVFRNLRESGFLDSLLAFAPWSILIMLFFYTAFGIYDSLWKYVSMEEAIRIGLAVLSGSVIQYVLMVVTDHRVPRSFPVFYALILAVLTVFSRFSYRLTRMARRDILHKGGKQRTMLIGAGAAGAMLLRDLEESELSRNKVVCVIDDDPSKRGMRVSGIPIVGGRESVVEMADRYKVEEIILAIPSLPPSEQRVILGLCQQTGISTRTLPGLKDLANGTVSVEKLRKVRIEDLLGRDSVQVDMSEITSHIEGRTVLVTGGGGSIGSELCRQVAARNPGKLIIFDIYENNAYALQQELRHDYPELELIVRIGSVRDTKRIDMLFDEFRPEIVFHAAAHKHVPLMEDSPCEAVKNNVFGTYHVADAAARFGTDAFVLISTDKAVNPTNVMGASKRICELIIQMFAEKNCGTRYVAVRFGNVLGSNGSVIPLFRRQIEYGGPVTVTDKDIIRYFMTIPEAVSLILQAAVYAKGGEIFILDMGQPVRIDDLARNMIRLSGFEPDVDIKIEYTGLRPGEKLYEELLLKEEGLEKTANDLIFVGHPQGVPEEVLTASLEKLKKISEDNSAAVVDEIARLVPTYHKQ